MKVVITRPDGYKIEMDASAEDIVKLLATLLPPYFNLNSGVNTNFTTTFTAASGLTNFPSDLKFK